VLSNSTAPRMQTGRAGWHDPHQQLLAAIMHVVHNSAKPCLVPWGWCAMHRPAMHARAT
jgi:hypothetical protein